MFKLPSLLPKRERFSALLEQLSREASDCGRELKIFVESSDLAASARAATAISDGKSRSKALALEVTEELCRSFITPFDREDIQDFSGVLYKIPKVIEKIKDRIELHNMTRGHGDYSAQIDVIIEQAETMNAIVNALVNKRDARQIEDKIARMDALEQRGDDILSDRLGSLFAGTPEARELILHKDIYDMLEKVIDLYRDAASVALQIVLKHS